MGFLKQVESLDDPAKAPYVFSKRILSGELGFKRRDATFTIGNVDYGASPFDNGAAAVAPIDWPWQCRVLTKGHPDVAKDALYAAVGGGELQRLVWSHDGGYERVVHGHVTDVGWAKHMDDHIYVDARVTWKILEAWHERGAANQLVAGLTTIIAGQASPVIAGTQSYALASTGTINLPNTIADASAAGPGGVPIYADTMMQIIINGPYGGDTVLDANGKAIGGGFALFNKALQIRDTNGNLIYPSIGVARKVPAGESCTIDCGSQLIGITNYGNATQLKYKPRVQPYWFIVKPGVNNPLQIQCNGPNPIAGGNITFVWNRKWL